MTWPAHGYRPPAACGTDAGYTRHRKTLHDDPCTACKAAHSAAEAARARRRRARRNGPLGMLPGHRAERRRLYIPDGGL